MQISWLKLLYKGRGDCECHENRKESRLHIDVAVAQMPESESVEEASEYMKHYLPLHDGKVSVELVCAIS